MATLLYFQFNKPNTNFGIYSKKYIILINHINISKLLLNIFKVFPFYLATTLLIFCQVYSDIESYQCAQETLAVICTVRTTIHISAEDL